MSLLYLNGKILSSDDAAISTGDQGFLLGHGFFETLRVEQGEPLAFPAHYERFSEAAERLNIVVPSESELSAAVSDLLKQSEVSAAKMRITVTAGTGEKPTLLITTGPLPEYAESARVISVPWPRNEKGALSGIKSTSYSENLLAMKYAKERGADDAVFANTRGNLCEGATTNVFVVMGGRLLTPPLSSGCLPGTCRRRVLELCKSEDIPVWQEDIPMPLAKPEFAFLTSSLRYLQPVHRFDDHILPITHPVFDILQKHSPNR
ncbi:MAG: aminotransferase class IV [Verrucomicrobiales bacterium]|nr:aminotransferase class IV [Verrucomicrobiales bacterium]